MIIHKLLGTAFLAGTFLLLGSGTAQAGLIGSTIGVQTLFPTQSDVCCGSGSAVVGAGVEFPTDSFPSYNSSAFVDVGDFQIDYGMVAGTSYSGGAFNGFRFYDILGTIAPITGVTIDGATNLVGFDSTRLTFDADNIYINLQGLSPADAHLVRLDVSFGEVAPGRIPEPSTLGLLLSSVALLAAPAWRRRKRSV